MNKPWKIAFPELVEPWSHTPCLVFMSEVIAPAHPGEIPSMMSVLGLGKDGNHYRFVVTIGAFEIASRNAVNLLQCDDIAAPRAKVSESRLVSIP